VSFVDELAAVCDEVGLRKNVVDKLTDDLVGRHSEAGRHYHTTAHIEAVLRHLDTLDARSITTAFSAFFHDAIYDPRRSDNEEKSANYARAILGACRIGQASDVAAMINATAGHELAEGLPAETASFLDADLAILGQASNVYQAYTLAIRAEYKHLSDDEFRTGRAAVLHSFGDRPTLFFTEAGRELWEAPARANIARELAALSI